MPKINLCQFGSNGELESFEAETAVTTYIAISHVWGPADWTNIPGIRNPVILSPHKVDFLITKLPRLVGQLPFWMDVLCVDQRSRESRIAIVKFIPDIYRNATRTIAVRDGDGFRRCCADAIGSFTNWTSGGQNALLHHVRCEHLAGGLTEAYLFRLWPLEEILLSDIVQFEVCADRQTEPISEDADFGLSRVTSDCLSITASLNALGSCWFRKGRSDATITEETIGEFAKAFLTCHAPISRPSSGALLDHPSSSDNLWYEMNINSIRTTSKPRDFVLAVMVQYNWYRVPQHPGDMTFAELFLDCYRQSHEAGFGFNSKLLEMTDLPRGVDQRRWVPANDIPAPRCLGDFVKLIGPPSPTTSPINVAVVARTFDRRRINTPMDMASVLGVTRAAMRFSPRTWSLAHRGGELSKYPVCNSAHQEQTSEQNTGGAGTSYLTGTAEQDFRVEQEASDSLVEEVSSYLGAQWTGLEIYGTDSEARNDWIATLRPYLVSFDPPEYKQTLFFLAAMISCGIPLSAFDWARRKLYAVVILFGDQMVLALILRSLIDGRNLQHFHIVEQRQEQPLTGSNLVLAAMDGSPIGYLPDFNAVEDDNEFLQHMRLLYRDLYVQQNGHIGLTRTVYLGLRSDGTFGLVDDIQDDATAAWSMNFLSGWAQVDLE